MVRTLGVGGAKVLERLPDAHQRRLPHAAAAPGGCPGRRALPLPPLPPHPFVLVLVVVVERRARQLGDPLRCGERGLAGPAVSRLGGGRSVDAALLRGAEGKPRASPDGERVAQRVWPNGHARRVDHGMVVGAGWLRPEDVEWNRAGAAHAQARGCLPGLPIARPKTSSSVD